MRRGISGLAPAEPGGLHANQWPMHREESSRGPSEKPTREPNLLICNPSLCDLSLLSSISPPVCASVLSLWRWRALDSFGCTQPRSLVEQPVATNCRVAAQTLGGARCRRACHDCDGPAMRCPRLRQTSRESRDFLQPASGSDDQRPPRATGLMQSVCWP